MCFSFCLMYKAPICFTGAPDSKTFDVPLMVALIRNLTELPEPTAGYDKYPSSTDTKPTDDLVRIKYYRNKLAHDDEKSDLFSTNFISTWEDISGVRIFITSTE